MTQTQVLKLLKILQGAYPRTPFTEDAIDVYTTMLSDLPYEATSKAIHNLIATSKWLPTIAEIRAAVAEVAAPIQSAEEAWVDVLDAARDFTPGVPAEKRYPLQPLARKAVAVMGGLEAIAFSDNSEFMAREFRRVYDRLAESETIRRQQSAGLGLPQLRALPGGDAS